MRGEEGGRGVKGWGSERGGGWEGSERVRGREGERVRVRREF